MNPKTPKRIRRATHLLTCAFVGALATGCASSGGMSGIGMRANGNQTFVLKQQYAGAGQLAATPSGSGVNGNPSARQGGSGGIVNNFYVGANSSAQQAEKSTDALKAAANVSATGQGTSQSSGSPGVQPTNSNQNNSPSNNAQPATPPAPATPQPEEPEPENQ